MEFVHSNRDIHDYLVLNASCVYHRITREIHVESQKSLGGIYDPTFGESL